MESNASKSNQKFLASTFGLLLLIAACSHIAVAQTNTFPTSGNVGVGTMTPAAKLEVSGDNPLPRVTNTNASSYGGLELFEGGTLKFGLHTMGSASGSSFVGGANALQLWNYANSPMVFGTNANERMRIDANGNVGIGVVPVSKFEIGGSDASQLFGRITNTASAGTTGWTAQNDISKVIEMGVRGSTRASYGALVANDAYVYGLQNLTIMADGGVTKFATGGNAERMRIDASGNVGIGTASPTAKLHVSGSGNIAGIVQSTTAGAELDLISSATNYGSWGMGTGWATPGVRSFYLYDNVASAARLVVDASGNVGVGTTTPSATLHVQGTGRFTGNLTVDGNINAKYQDVAEWVPASHALPAGTVVTLDPTKSNHVEASSHAYDTRVAGVVSAQPGITLGEQSDNKVLVATTGRVKVMVDAASGPIDVGDLLVTSDIAGVAKKSEPLLLGGVPIHRPGTLIGKALEPLAQGRGEILVLLSLQ